jgi:hypothetical protein
MKSLSLLLLVILSCLQHANSQSFVVDSTRFITGNNCCTGIIYSIPTADKGILFIGYEANNPGGIIPFFSDTVFENVLIGKIDSDQHISWIKVFGGGKDDIPACVCQTPDGGYAIVCTTTSTDGDVPGLIDSSGEDMWLIKIDASGNLLWSKCYGSGNNGTEGLSVANTPDHGFILLGATNGTGADVPFHYGGTFSIDWLVVKTDSVGNKQWSKDLGGTGSESEYGAILSANDGYYLISSTNSTDHDCTDTSWHSGVLTGYDDYILKIDTSGSVLWDKSYGGSGAEDVVSAMFDTRDSSIVITGSTSSYDYMVAGGIGGGDFWVIKINTDGRLLWQKVLGGPNQDGGYSTCIASDGGYITYGETVSGPIGYYDCWLFALDSIGHEITNKVIGGTNLDGSASILPYRGGYVATGTSASLSFTEGTTYGNFDLSSLNPDGGGAFISYLNLSPLSINSINPITPRIIIYPNPAYDAITIKVITDKPGTLNIFNAIGEKVYSARTGTQIIANVINVNEWPVGLYIGVWQGADGSVLENKFIKN